MSEVERTKEACVLVKTLAEMLKPTTYVEIGIRNGGVFNNIAPLVERAVAVDKKRQRGLMYFPNAEYWFTTSKQFAREWTGTIDFLFINGGSTYKDVSEDFYMLSPLVRKHTGLIFIHDTFPVQKQVTRYCGTAWKFACELSRDKTFLEYETVTIPGPVYGLTIVRHAPTHGWMEEAK